MSAPKLDVALQDSAFDPDSSDHSKIEFMRARSRGSANYRVYIYLDGPDLPFVDVVAYTLHETFDPRVREVRRTIDNPRCKLELWTWGTFELVAEVISKDRRRSRLSHELRWDEDLKRSDVKFVARNPSGAR